MRTLLTLVFSFTTLLYASASTYEIDEAKIEQQFESSESLNYYFHGATDFTHAMNSDFHMANPAAAEKSNTTAALIAFGSVLLPWIISVPFNIIAGLSGVAAIGWIGYLLNVAITIVPWHRFYLGTGGENAKIFLLYCVTLRWCSVLPIIDGIMLLMDDTGEKYFDNPKYVMWLN